MGLINRLDQRRGGRGDGHSPPRQHREIYDCGLAAQGPPPTDSRSRALGPSARCSESRSGSRGIFLAAQVMLGQVRLLQLLSAM